MKPSPSYPGYTVSRGGIVKNRFGQVMSQHINSYGAPQISVSCPKYRGSANVARIVGEVYCEDFDKSLRAAYRDGNKLNCRASNLYWVPVSEVTRAPYSKNPRK